MGTVSFPVVLKPDLPQNFLRSFGETMRDLQRKHWKYEIAAQIMLDLSTFSKIFQLSLRKKVSEEIFTHFEWGKVNKPGILKSSSSSLLVHLDSIFRV